MNDEQHPSQGPFRYHLELTPAQLKITHTALHALLNDFGHEESDVHKVIREVLDKLPDDHAMRAVRLDDELARELAPRIEGEDQGQGPPTGGESPPDSVA